MRLQFAAGKANWRGLRSKMSLEGGIKSGMFLLPLEYSHRSSSPERVRQAPSVSPCLPAISLPFHNPYGQTESHYRLNVITSLPQAGHRVLQKLFTTLLPLPGFRHEKQHCGI